MNGLSVAYVVLAWVGSIFVTAFTLLFWDTEADPWSTVGVLALVLVALALTAGFEMAGWWRSWRALGELYLKACERTSVARRERDELRARLGISKRSENPPGVQDLEAVLAAELWSPEARAGIRACISKLKTGDHRSCLDEAREHLGIAKRGQS